MSPRDLGCIHVAPHNSLLIVSRQSFKFSSRGCLRLGHVRVDSAGGPYIAHSSIWVSFLLAMSLSLVTFSQRRTSFKRSRIYASRGVVHILSIMNTSCSLATICTHAPLICNAILHFVFCTHMNCILGLSHMVKENRVASSLWGLIIYWCWSIWILNRLPISPSSHMYCTHRSRWLEYWKVSQSQFAICLPWTCFSPTIKSRGEYLFKSFWGRWWWY